MAAMTLEIIRVIPVPVKAVVQAHMRTPPTIA
jgi:hypothetical protein